MEKFSFFDSVDGDRRCQAEDWARHMSAFFTDGIFNNSCRILGNTNDMSVTMESGRANIKGYRYDDDASKILTIDNADGVLNRIDNIVIRLDLTNRTIRAMVIKGTPATNPVAPNLERTSTIYDLRIAKVSVPAGTTEITQSLITDTRFITSDCGNVICAVQTPDTEQLFIQIQSLFNDFIENNTESFDTWFNHIKGQLSTDQAGHLQNEIDELTPRVDTLEDKVDVIEGNILDFEESREIEEENVKVYKPQNASAIESESIRFRDEKLSDILGNKTAGYHNSIFRGKDITDRFYDGSLSTQIAQNDFTDIFIGDYIIGRTSGRKYLVADINYRLHCGDTDLTTPHILMIPEKTMGNAMMNDSNTSAGGYKGSKMYTTYLTPYKTVITNDFGSNHLLNHRSWLTKTVTNGYASDGEWTDSKIELMNEAMVYGGQFFNNILHGTNTPTSYTIDKSQLALFRLDKSYQIAFNDGNSRQWYWLRDVWSASGFCGVYIYGSCYCSHSSSSGGVRPCFLIY